MAFDKLKNLFVETTDVEDRTLPEDEYYESNDEKQEVQTGNKMILLEPRAYSESQQIADHLKKRDSVVEN